MTKYFCDICGNEVNDLKGKEILISFYGEHENKRIFEICECCERELEIAKKQAEVNFIKGTYWWKQNSDSDGEINYGHFKRVGDCEQGGIICPKCGCNNNMYTFDGVCQCCGYKRG